MKWGSRGQFFASDTTLCFVSRSPGSQNVCERETGPKSWLWQESIGPDCFLSVHGHRSWNLQIPTIPPTGSWFTESQRLKLQWGSASHPHCSTSVLHCRLRVRCGTWRFKVFVLQVGTVCFLNDLYPCYLTWTNLNPPPSQITRVTVPGRIWVWCNVPETAPGWQDSDSRPRRACGTVQSHSSCHRFWYSLVRRCRTQHRVYTEWLMEESQIYW